MKTYFIRFYGSEEQINNAIRKADHIFRQCYNVYGGRRVYSRKGMCRMSYTANWQESGLCSYSWKEVWSLIEEKMLKMGYEVSVTAQHCVWGI